jgi:hypothetical protein
VHRQLRSWFPSSRNYGFRCNTPACSHNRPSCTCQWPFVQSLGPKSRSRPREWLSNKELSSKYPREKTCRQPIVKPSGPGNGGRQLQEWVKLRNTQAEHSSSGFPPTADICPIPGMVRRPPIRATVTSENCRPRRRANSQAVACSRGLARGRLQCHSATAKQYCSSSSFVARHALLFVFEACLEMDAIGPDVDVALRRQIALLSRGVFVEPTVLQAADGGCRQPSRILAEQRRQRLGEVAGRDPLQIKDRQQRLDRL